MSAWYVYRMKNAKNLAKQGKSRHWRRNFIVIKILFVCHGTTSISWVMPGGATINHVTHPNYYNFTTFLSSDMNLLQQKTVLKEANNAFFRTAFCLSAILSKTCFSGRQTYLGGCNWGAQSAWWRAIGHAFDEKGGCSATTFSDR